MSLPGGSGIERPLWSPAMSKTAAQNTAAVQNTGRPSAAGMSVEVWERHLWEKSEGRDGGQRVVQPGVKGRQWLGQDSAGDRVAQRQRWRIASSQHHP